MKTTKEVTVLCRYTHKTNGKLNGTVTYCVRSSNGKDFYYTTLVEGKASGCSCPAKAGCYHKKGLENKETARPFAARQLPAWASKLVSTGKLEVPGKAAKIAKEVGITVEQVQELAEIAIELRQDTKHTDFELPLRPGRKPRKYATEMMEAEEHKASILAECREIKARRESAPLNGNRGFQLMR